MRNLLVTLVLFVIIGALALPLFQQAHEMGTYALTCKHSLKGITLALHNYHDKYGSFPPAVVRNSEGKAMHSWRVLILPFLDCEHIYSKYNFNEPWNSQDNLALEGSIPEYYRCWKCQPGLKESTTVVAITGSQTCWPSHGSVSFDDITDGMNNTIQLISFSGSNIHWMEPRDYSIHDQLPPSTHGNGHPIAFADGIVGFLPSEVALNNFATISNNDYIDRTAIERVP